MAVSRKNEPVSLRQLYNAAFGSNQPVEQSLPKEPVKKRWYLARYFTSLVPLRFFSSRSAAHWEGTALQA